MPAKKKSSSAAKVVVRRGGRKRKKKLGGGESYLSPETPLSKRHLFFCLRYVTHFNGALAAREAGFSSKAAKQAAYIILNDPRIGAECARLIEQKFLKADMDATEVLRSLRAMVSISRNDFFIGEDGQLHLKPDVPSWAWLAVASVDYHPETGRVKRFRMFDRNQAVANGMRHLGILNDFIPAVPPGSANPTPANINIRVNLVSPKKEQNGNSGR